MAQPMIFDADFEAVGDPDNLISFPGNISATSQQHLGNSCATVAQPFGSSCATAQQLADIAGITRQQWQRDFYPKFLEICPADQLRDGRSYTPLCETLTRSLLDAKADGMSAAAWIDRIGRPRWGQTIDPPPMPDIKTAAIVPVSFARVAESQSLALSQAQSLQGFAGAVLAQLSQHLVAHQVETTAANNAIDEAAIVADELIKIARENRIRANVRAQAQSQQQATKSADLAKQLEQLQGGQHV